MSWFKRKPPSRAQLNDRLIPATHEGVSAVRSLVEQGADVNYQNPRFRNGTPLHTAAANGYLDVAEYLIAQGAIVNAINNDGDTPLDRAASPPRDLSRGMGLPPFPGDSGKANRKRAVARLLMLHGARCRAVDPAPSIDPRVRDQLEALIPGLVFQAHIRFRGKSKEEVVSAVESQLDCKFIEDMPSAKRQTLRNEVRNLIEAEYERKPRP